MLPANSEGNVEPLSVEQLRAVAALQGYSWSPEELERLRPQVERALALVERLDALISQSVEPAFQYRML